MRTWSGHVATLASHTVMSRRPPEVDLSLSRGGNPPLQDEDQNLPRGAKRYQGPQPPEISSTALPDPFEENVRSATWPAAIHYLTCVANVDSADWAEAKLHGGVSDAFFIRPAIEPSVLPRVRRFFEMAARARRLVVSGRTYAFPSTRFATYVQPNRGREVGVTWFLFHGHEEKRRQEAIEILCRYMEEVNRAGCNTAVLSDDGVMVFRTCGSEPFHIQITRAVRSGECTLEETILRTLSSSGCALYWALPEKPEGSVWGTTSNTDEISRNRYTVNLYNIHGVLRRGDVNLLHRPFSDPFVSGVSGLRDADGRRKLKSLGYIEIRLPSMSTFLCPRIQSGDNEGYEAAASTVRTALSPRHARHEAEMHALSEIQSLVVPVVFAHHYYGWVAISDAELRRTVTSWYVDETGYLGPEEVAGMVAQYL